MSLRLLMADRTLKKLVGILCDVLVKVASFIILVDFVILNYEVDYYIPIILRRPFQDMGSALVDMEIGNMKFWLNDDQVTFNVG